MAPQEFCNLITDGFAKQRRNSIAYLLVLLRDTA